MSLWWFDQLADLVPNHVVSTDVPDAVRGRAVVCEALEMFPVECVARGYLTGSGLLDYRAHRRGLRGRAAGRARGRQPAPGADLHARPPRPRSATTTRTSPTTRSSPTVGAERRGRAARADARGLRPGRGDRPRARHHPGRHQARVRRAGATARSCSADEVLTPDSSRFWPADEWQPGRPQPSYDKQFVRDWLPSAGERLGPDVGRAAAAAAADVVDADPGPVRRGLRAADRRDLLTERRPMRPVGVDFDAPASTSSSPTSSTRATGPSGRPACAGSRTSTATAARRHALGRRHRLSAPGRGCRSPSWSPAGSGPSAAPGAASRPTVTLVFEPMPTRTRVTATVDGDRVRGAGRVVLRRWRRAPSGRPPARGRR